MDIGKAFVDAWEVYKKNYIILILSYLTFLILSIVTIGILAIPLSVGFKMMYAKASRGQEIVFNDIFSQMKNFAPLSLCTIWKAILILSLFIPAVVASCVAILYSDSSLSMILLQVILYLAATIVTVYFTTCWMYAHLLISDQAKRINESLRVSKEMVRKNGFWIHYLLLILIGIINMVSMQVIIFLLVMPYTSGVVTCAYLQEIKE